MKKFWITLLSFCLLSLPALAGERLILGGLGAATGTMDWQTTDSMLAAYNDSLDHDLEGSSFSVAYVSVEDSGFVWGGGYHSYTVSGESALQSAPVVIGGTTYETKVQLTTTSYSLSGLYGVAGYNLPFAERFRFLPHVRVLLSNTVQADAEIFTRVELGGLSSESTSTGSDSDSVSGMMIALPLTYSLGDVELGLEIVSFSAVYEKSTGSETFTYTLDGATQLALAYRF